MVGSGEGIETGEDLVNAARMPERAVVLVVVGPGLADVTRVGWDWGWGCG